MLPAEVPIPLGLLVAIRSFRAFCSRRSLTACSPSARNLAARLPPAQADAARRAPGDAAHGRHLGPVARAGHRDGAQLQLRLPRRAVDGILAMIWFTTVAGTFSGGLPRRRACGPRCWGTQASTTLPRWPCSSLRELTLLGPLPVGLISSAEFAASLWLFISPRAARPSQQPGHPARSTTETADTEFIGETALTRTRQTNGKPACWLSRTARSCAVAGPDCRRHRLRRSASARARRAFRPLCTSCSA